MLTPSNLSSRREANFEEMSACSCVRMLTPNFPAPAMASCVLMLFSTHTSTGCSESDANEATVIPYALPSCSVVTMVTPLAKCDIASLNCASSTGMRATQFTSTAPDPSPSSRLRMTPQAVSHPPQPDVPARGAQHHARSAAVEFSFQRGVALLAEQRHRHVGLDVAAAGVRVEIDGDARGDGQRDAAAGGLQLGVAAGALGHGLLDGAAGGRGVDDAVRFVDGDGAARGVRGEVAGHAMNLDVAARRLRADVGRRVADRDVAARGRERDRGARAGDLHVAAAGTRVDHAGNAAEVEIAAR